MDDCGFAVVWNQHPGCTAKVVERVDVCLEPTVLLLVTIGFSESVLAVTQYSDENIDQYRLASIRVYVASRITGPVYFNSVTRAM